MLALTSKSGFHAIDWAILLGYLGLVVGIGLMTAKKRRDGDDYFLAGRSMPMWAVAISILATAQSAATFVGGPQEAYAGDLTYLATNIGPIIAAIVVGFLFLPRFYQHNVTSVYELIGHEIGSVAQRLASGMFMLGRVFASGARLFIVAIPFSLVTFGDLQAHQLALSIVIITIGATIYSMAGGIRAVIWTDVMQVVVYLICICIALALIWQKIPVSPGEVMHALRTDPEGDKLLLFDFSLDLSRPYTVWASLVGFTLLMIAAYGADQDLTQRMLTCKTPRRASWSVITATLVGLPVVLIFLVMGLLLYVFFQRPDVMGEAMPMYEIEDTRRVFLSFIINDMPVGLRGLMMAGLFAAAMSSMDSSLNAMSSTTVADFYRPWRANRDSTRLRRTSMSARASSSARERRVSCFASLFWASMLCGFALFCIWWQQQAGETLIAFALGVMTFAYSGLLGVFFTAMFTNRGTAASAVAAMAVGFFIVLLMDPIVWPHLTEPLGIDTQPAFAWRLTVAAAISFIVCASPSRASR